MSAPEGNSLFCFPENLNVFRDEVEGNIEIRVKTKLFPEQTLSVEESVLLCSDNQKSTFSNIHTTIKQFQQHILLSVVYFSYLLQYILYLNTKLENRSF